MESDRDEETEEYSNPPPLPLLSFPPVVLCLFLNVTKKELIKITIFPNLLCLSVYIKLKMFSFICINEM